MNDHPYLIIGNSVAAMAAVEGIREADRETPITIVAKEPYHTYSRPLISYLLGGMVTEEDMYYRPEDFYERAGVEALLGVEVVSVDAENKTVRTAGGEEFGFDTLLIATGGEPIVPPGIPGADAEGVFTFTTWDDAREIDQYIEEAGVERALIIGGGLIGLKSVEALVERGIDTTVVELADRILNTTFDHTAARLAQAKLEEHGVTVMCENTVAEIETERGRVVGALLRDGTAVECEMVIFAIGVAPNTGLVEDTSIEVDRGILTDEHMMTSVADIYAAGDVAQARCLLTEDPRCIAIFPDAYRQGRVAGSNMAGGEARYHGGLAMNAVDICGLPTVSVGLTAPEEGEYEVISELDEDKPDYRKIVLDGNRIVGAIFIGPIERAGIITGLIRQQIDVSRLKDLLLTDDFGLISLPREYRKHVVSGVGIEV